MGTKERRQREFSEREELFLDIALELIQRDGLLNLQMSRLADKAEYAVGTLYLHFVSKEDLLLALVTRVFRHYMELVRLAQAWNASSRDRMFAVAVAELVFVRRYPEYFRIAQYSLCEVSWGAASPERRQAFLDANRPVMALVATIVEDARQAGDLEPAGASPQEIASGLWAMCGGFHLMAHAEGLLANFQVTQPYLLMCRHLSAWLDGMKWKPLSRSDDPVALERLVQRVMTDVFNEACNDPR